MPEDTTPVPEQVSALYKQLAASAAVLNSASDEFSKAVAPLDLAIRALNLGIECWVRVNSYTDDNEYFTSHDLGYAKVGGEWGIALRIVTGNEQYEIYDEDRWLFNAGPRQNRVEALEKLPELLARLTKKADSAAKKIKETTAQTLELASAIQKAATEVAPQPKKGVIPVTPKKPTSLGELGRK